MNFAQSIIYKYMHIGSKHKGFYFNVTLIEDKKRFEKKFVKLYTV